MSTPRRLNPVGFDGGQVPAVVTVSAVRWKPLRRVLSSRLVRLGQAPAMPESPTFGRRLAVPSAFDAVTFAVAAVPRCRAVRAARGGAALGSRMPVPAGRIGTSAARPGFGP
jgi:hypothetical protein